MKKNYHFFLNTPIQGSAQLTKLLVLTILLLGAISGFKSILSKSSLPVKNIASALELTKSVSNSMPLSGETFFYSLQYRCAGLTEDCLGTVITDPLPAGLEFVGVLGSVHTTSETYNSGTNTVTFTFIDPLVSGTTGEVRIEVRFPNGTTPDGTVANNTATISASNATSVSSSISTTASAIARIGVSKSLLGGGASNGYATYHLMICNGTSGVEEDGTLNLNSITIVDTLPPGSIFVETNLNTGSSATYDAASHSVTIIHSSLATGECIFPKISVQYPEPTFNVGDDVTNEAFWTVTPVGEIIQTVTDSETFPLKVPNYLAETYKTLGNPTLFPGESSTYFLEGVVSGTEPINQFCINDTIPSEIEITSFSLGGWYYGGLSGPSDIMNVSYTTNLNGPTLLSGSPRLMWTNDVIDVENDLGLTIGGGEYITALNFCFGDIPSGFEEFSPIELTFVVKSSTSPGVVTNCSELSTTSPNFELRNECVDLTVAANAGIARLNPVKSIWPSGTHDRGDIIVFQIAIRNELGAVDSVVNPIAYDLLPEGMEYVSGTWSLPGWGNTYGFPDPTFTFISDYEGTGREFLKWEWPAGIKIPPGERVVIAFNTEITDEAVGGFPAFYNNTYIQTPNSTDCISGIQDADVYDFDNDGDVSELFCGNRIAVNINELLALESEKLVRGQFDDNYTKFPDVGNSVPGGLADYILEVRNPGNLPMDSVVVIDILPSVGDIGVIDVTNRDSRWQPNLVSSVSAPAGITVYYSTAANPCRADEGLVPSGPIGCDVPNWSTTIPTDLTTVRSLKFDFGSTVLQPMDTIQLAWAMRVPVNIFSTIGAQPDSIAWNSFGYIGRQTGNGQYTLPSEPVKVGIDLNNVVPNVIGDFVWEDTNQNGIQDGGESGINGVRVELFRDNGDGISDPASDRFINFTVTANGGYYLFPNLPDYDYYVVFYKPPAMDFATNDAGGNDAVDSDGIVGIYNGFDVAITPVVTLDNFAYDLSWDLGLHTSSTGAIGNYVWNDANGNGIQDESTSEGINGVTIYLYDNNSPTVPIDSVITSSDFNGNSGYYLFSEVPSGNYFLELSLPSGVAYATQGPNGSSDLSDSDFNSSTNRTEVFIVTGGNYDNTWDAGLILSGVEICDNGIDDDGDTFADCADVDCPCPLDSICLILGPNLVINGEFDEGNVGFDSDYNYVSFPVFNTSGNYGNYTVGLDNTLTNFYNIWKVVDRNAIDGNFLAADPSSSSGLNDDIWRQTVDVCPNTDFVFSAWAKNIFYLEAGIQPVPNFSFYINDVLLPSASFEVPQQSLADSMIWFQMNGLWNSGTATTAEMRIVNTNRGTTGNDLAIDGIYLAMCGSDIDIEPNLTSMCPGESVLLSATDNTIGSGWFFYEWLQDGVVVSSGTTETTFSASASGSYVLQVYTTSDNSGCANESNAIVIAASPQSGDVVIVPCAEVCDDGIDNDLDGLTDCMDFDCGCAVSEICTTGDSVIAATYNVWHTGSGGGLDFNQLQTSGPLAGYPSTFADLGTTSFMPKQEGGATFCDPRSGEVIIYSDGQKAWDKDGNEFSTSDAQNRFNTLSTNLASAAGTPIIVPAPGQCNANEELYIFFTDDHGGATPELYYVIVNVPAGTISNPTQLTAYEMSESISAVQVSCDTTWIVYRNELDMEAIRWTSAGFEAPVVTANIHKDTDQRYSSAFSLDGYRFAATLGFYPFESHEMMVASFDVSNGQFSNILYLNPFSKNGTIDPYVNYDVAFSPDGTKLYTSFRELSGGDKIVQYNLSAGDATDIENSGMIIGSDSKIGGLMNGPDGRIYASTGLGANAGINSIHVIDFPNLAGVACNFQADLISPGGAVTGGLNNMVYGLGATSCIPNISGNIGSNICEDITLDVLDCYLGDGGPYDISYKYNGVWDTIFAQTINANNEIVLTGLSTGIYDSIQVIDGKSCGSNYISLTLQDGSCPEICNNGFDDDLNGLTDCEETICIPIANPATLTTCDNSNGAGSGTFFLPDLNTDISGGVTGLTVYLYATLSDAQNGVNNLTSSYDSPNSTIYARVENDISGCFATAVVTLTVGAACAEICNDGIDNDGNGLIDCFDCESCASSVSCSDNDGDGIGDFCDLDDDNDGIPDSVECPDYSYGIELVENGDFEDAYANWTSDFNRGKNNYFDTRGNCPTQGWVAISPCSSMNGLCYDYYNYFGGTYDGSVVITDAYGTGANILPTTNCNSTNGSCLAENLPDHTTGSGFSIYVDPNDIPGQAYWKQMVTVEPGKNYEFSAWIMVIEEDPNLQFRINGVNLTAGFNLDRQTGGSNGPDVWQQFFASWYSGTTSGDVVVELVNLTAGCGGNDIRVDDVSLREVIADCDCDGDGVINSLDLDSDNDGLYDVVEAGHSATDANLDGVIDNANLNSGNNGLFDALETTPESGMLNYTVADSETSPDGILDICELDSDGDGCLDTEEEEVSDSDNDGIAGTGTASVEANGLVTSYTYTLPSNNTWQNPLVGSCLPEICDDGLDNDNDGNADCLDSDCIPIANPTTLNTCDNSNMTGSGIFFLYDANPTVSIESGVIISYHPTLTDAQNGVNNLISPHISSDGTVYVRVERISNGCFNTVLITLDVGVLCFENCVNGIDDDGDGLIDCDDTDCPCCKADSPNLNDLDKKDP